MKWKHITGAIGNAWALAQHFSLYLSNFSVLSEKPKNSLAVDICPTIELPDQSANRCFMFMISSFGVKYEMNKHKKNPTSNRHC